MSVTLHINASHDKAEKYRILLPQIEALISGENDKIANLANISAALQTTFQFLWVGFYLAKKDMLVLGPFQGGIACMRLQKGKGVCGTAWQQEATLIVNDVNQFDGHIFCSSSALSEIVVPIFNTKKEVVMVLDIDSSSYNTFDAIDQQYLEELAQLITRQDWV